MMATQMVHWPGRDTPACEEHAKKLQALAAHMGFSVSTTPLASVVECTNCENEKNK